MWFEVSLALAFDRRGKTAADGPSSMLKTRLRLESTRRVASEITTTPICILLTTRP
jgi:hypothetical protein